LLLFVLLAGPAFAQTSPPGVQSGVATGKTPSNLPPGLSWPEPVGLQASNS
jgi:hypothetical protein